MAERTRKPKTDKVVKVESKVATKVQVDPEKKKAKKARKAKKEKETAHLTQAPKTHVSKKGKKESKTKFNEPGEGKIWFRKVGRGSLRKIPGCQPIIKPNEKFLCRPEDIPPSFRNSIVAVDKENYKPAEDLQTADMAYRIKKLKNGLFNVVNKKAKKMNPTPLEREAAVKLRNELND